MGVAHKFTNAEAIAAGQKGGKSLVTRRGKDYMLQLGVAGRAAIQARTKGGTDNHPVLPTPPKFDVIRTADVLDGDA
jgi:hypothetical protein